MSIFTPQGPLIPPSGNFSSISSSIIDTTVIAQGLPPGGTTGQLLAKVDNTDYNAEWETIQIGAAGSNTQIQYNSNGSFAGNAGLTWNGTTLSANTLTSTVTTGTAPLTVTSTTPVANLVSSASNTTNALNSATTTVNVSSATAPTAGQVLTASSGTAANWQTPGGGGSKAYAFFLELSTTYHSGDLFQLGTQVQNSGSFTNVGGIITVNTTGIYLVVFSSIFDIVPDQIQLLHNGVLITEVSFPLSTLVTATINAVVNCVSGDNLRFFVSIGGTGSSITTKNNTNFTIVQIA